MTDRPIPRRRAIALLGLGAAGLMAGAAAGIGWLRSSLLDRRLKPADAGQPLHAAEVLASRDGLLDVTLVASPGVVLAGRSTSAWGYNATSPGPTLRLRPGDLLRIRLVNHLGQPTNLHTHGLHVSPLGSADNPFIAVAPGASFDYAIPIPADHPAGTFWYHPHHHGSVADQLFAGLAGALLVVRDEPELAGVEDRVLLITDTTLDGDGRVAAASMAQRVAGREGEVLLVNGQYQPTIAVAAGATERWRVINACVSRVLSLAIDGQLVTQIALDGRYLPAPLPRDRIILAPGNRADLLVLPSTPGRFGLVADPYDRGSAMMGSPAGTGERLTVATLVVAGEAATPTPHRIPAAPTMPNGDVVRRRRITFAGGMGAGMGGGMGMAAANFTIDGRRFDPGRDDQTVVAGDTEEWTLVNIGPMDHPFHLHVWPFEVLDVSSGPAPVGVGQDVVLVPAHGQVRIRIAFRDYTGRTVYHCHILDHEDLGMMGTVSVG